MAVVLKSTGMISKLHGSGRDNYAKRIVDFLHPNSLDLSQLPEKITDVYAFISVLKNKEINSSESGGSGKLPVSMERSTTTKVPNMYNKNMVKVFTNLIELCQSGADLRLPTYPM